MEQNEKYIQMTTTPVGRLIGKLAVPTVITMLITSIYNMADTFFVGLLDDTSATGAVGVVFSFMAIIQACGFLFGQGLGNSNDVGFGHFPQRHRKRKTVRQMKRPLRGIRNRLICYYTTTLPINSSLFAVFEKSSKKVTISPRETSGCFTEKSGFPNRHSVYAVRLFPVVCTEWVVSGTRVSKTRTVSAMNSPCARPATLSPVSEV